MSAEVNFFFAGREEFVPYCHADADVDLSRSSPLLRIGGIPSGGFRRFGRERNKERY